MRKPVFATCEQQRRRSACTSAQSDQRLCCLLLDSIIPLLAIAKISRLQLVFVAEQASLSLIWSQTPRDRFSRDESQIIDDNAFFVKSTPLRAFIRSFQCFADMLQTY